MRVPGLDTVCEHNLPIPEHVGALTCHPNGQSSKSRSFVVIRDLGPTHHLGVYNNNMRAVERALKERYFFVKTKQDGFQLALPVRSRAYETDCFLGSFRAQVIATCRAPIVSVDQVVNSYVGPKRVAYAKAADSLKKDAVSRRDALLNMFGKFEKQNLDKANRGINPRSKRFNLRLGKYLKFMEKPLYKAINKVYKARTAHTVIKGLNVADAAKVARAKWDLFRNPVALGLDAEKFDAHVSTPCLKYEHSFYTGIHSRFGNQVELKWLLNQQLKNTGVAYCDDGKIKFSIRGTRCSGDLNTSMGNCVIMCALVYAYSASVGVDIELMNNGDDCVVFMELEDLERYKGGVPEYFKRKGFRMTVEEPVTEFEQIEFCQSHPVFDGERYVMVRNLSNCLQKDPMCLVPIQNARALQQWYDAVGSCGLSLTSGVPVLQEFYKCFKRSGRPCSEGFKRAVFKNTSYFERVRDLREEDKVCSATSRCSFYFAFGVLPEHQIAIEAYYASMLLSSEVEEVMHRDYAYDKGDNCCPPVVSCLF